MGLFISCKEATAMSDRKHLQELSFTDTLKLKFHLSICKICALYNKQSLMIEKGIKKRLKSIDNVPAEDIEKIKEKIINSVKP